MKVMDDFYYYSVYIRIICFMLQTDRHSLLTQHPVSTGLAPGPGMFHVLR